MANEWNKTAFVEFETMLRRHLRSGAAPVAACAGFDLDAASAYLEGALGGPHLASYESHLAGCAICRRHLIELARLAQAAPSFEARPAAEPVRIPARDRLKKTVAGWFDLSAWNLKWQIAGATGGAFAILIAALGAQSLYQASNRDSLMISKASTTSPIAAAESGIQQIPSPSPEPSTLDLAAVAEESDAIHSAHSRAPVPTPAVGPKESSSHVIVPAPVESLATLSVPSEAPVVAKPSGGEARRSPPPQQRNFLQVNPLMPAVGPEESASQVNVPAPVQSLATLSVPSGAPVVAKQRGDEGGQSPPPQPRNFLQLNELTRTGESGLGEFGGDSGQLAANVTAQDPRDMSRYQPKLIGGRPESRLNAPPDRRSRLRVLPEIKLWSLPEIWRRLNKSDSGTESERKAKPDKQEASDDGTPKPMMVMIRGKVFDFKKGMLTDREYKPEMQKWNVWTLKQGSEQYKRALAAEPLLKEFFDRAPILIVWGDRIYKVLK